MDVALFAIQLLNGVQYGLLLFLIASGLTLIFGIMGVINLAHGSFYMVGAYMAFALSSLTGSFVATLLIGTALAAALGALLEGALFRHLYRRDHLDQVLLTYGLILIFEELRSIAFGNDVHGVPLPAALDWSFALTQNLSYPVYRVVVSVACVVLAAAMFWLLQFTRLGMTIRAGTTHPEMVNMLGINVRRLYRVVFALGTALAAAAGMLAAPLSSVYPGMGSHVLIASLVVVVIGGVGSVPGALVAALCIGLTDTFGKVFFPAYAGVAVYVMMAAVLLWRPEGLLKRRLA
jgi:branched-chain amino acid transport system permease protein